jgi:hypothetical protein
VHRGLAVMHDATLEYPAGPWNCGSSRNFCWRLVFALQDQYRYGKVHCACQRAKCYVTLLPASWPVSGAETHLFIVKIVLLACACAQVRHVRSAFVRSRLRVLREAANAQARMHGFLRCRPLQANYTSETHKLIIDRLYSHFLRAL